MQRKAWERHIEDAQAWLAARAKGDIQHGLPRARETGATGVVWEYDEISPNIADEEDRKLYEQGQLSWLCATLVVDGKVEVGIGGCLTFDILFNVDGKRFRRDVEAQLVSEYVEREDGVERLVREGFAL